MEFFETVKNIEKTYEEKEILTPEELAEVDKTFIEMIYPDLLNVEVKYARPGKVSKVGKISEICDTSCPFETFAFKVQFADEEKVFVLKPLVTTSYFNKILDEEVLEKCVKLCELHNNLTKKYNKYLSEQRQLEREVEKKAEAEKKAEEKYQKLKAKTIKEFETRIKQPRKSLSEVDEFYYALGWLAKHVSKISASIPDYLQSSFENYFGTDVSPYVVDSSKKTSGGFSYQWGIGMNARLCGKDIDTIPPILSQYFNSTGKVLYSTSFIWDLVDNYGFQFGKTQDVDKILSLVPAQYKASFELGLA